MKSQLWFALCLAALFPLRAACDDDSTVNVDTVVDLTDAGEAIAHPTADHPAYYYPVVRGYTPGQAFLPSQKDPPPSFEVLHSIAKALAQQGYLYYTKTSPPSLVLVFWWGYKAPIFGSPNGGESEVSSALNSMSPSGGKGPQQGQPGGGGGIGDAASALEQAARNGQLPTAVMTNHTEMEELVFGGDYGHENLQNHPSLRLERLNNASRVSRYYLMVSALDFKAGTQKKLVLLWTARVSTEIGTQTLAQILPTLIAKGVPRFGRATDGPQWSESTLVPMGHVIVGTPVLKPASAPALPAPPAKP